mgnify:FL=1
MGTLAFAKYQGLGNDFLVVDNRSTQSTPSCEELVDGVFVIAQALCDRRYGVGGDGVLSLTKPTTADAVATMRVLNADGSEAEMCGNGLRCVAKFLAETGDDQPDSVLVDTGAGPLDCRLEWQEDVVVSITVNMGRPRLRPSEIPMAGVPDTTSFVEQPLELAIGARATTAVSMGNPHAVAFVPESGAALEALTRLHGAEVETHVAFPSRTNAEFAHVVDASHIELWVWERGCGITQACGTGACATAVAACLTGKAELETEIEVALPGGPLTITVAKDYATVFMRGPAVHVFDGTVTLP